MANCCTASITLMKEETFTDDDIQSIEARLRQLDHCGNGAIGYRDDTLLEWDGDTRWNIPTPQLTQIALDFGCRIRAIGREDGCAFVQVVCVDDDGKVVQDEEIDYAF